MFYIGLRGESFRQDYGYPVSIVNTRKLTGGSRFWHGDGRLYHPYLGCSIRNKISNCQQDLYYNKC